MLYIHYNQTKPNQTAFEYAIQGNNNVDVVCFDIKEIELGFEPTHIYVKVQSKDKKYIDKIELTKSNGVLNWHLLAKTTRHKVVSVQLSFETDTQCFQTEMVELTLKPYINAEEEIENDYPMVLQDLQRQIDEMSGGGGASSVEIEKIWLTYDDKASIRTDVLGVYEGNKPFVNDSTRIWVNFKTNVIGGKVIEEIKNGRFVIRLDYPMKSRNINLTYDSGGRIYDKQPQNDYGVGVRSYCHNFKNYQAVHIRSPKKNEILKRSLIFVNESDIKINRYGEKYIHKKISLFEYITNICELIDIALYPITNEKIQEGQELYDFFDIYVGEAFQIGIPTINQHGLEASDLSFNGGFVYKCYSKSVDFVPNIENSEYKVNGKKLNPAFTCYTPLYTKNNVGENLSLFSPYWNNHHNNVVYTRKLNEELLRSSFYTMFRDRKITQNSSKRNYMVAKPRCAILNEDWENADYSFLKTFPQATQDIKLVCKAIRDVDDFGVNLMPIFRIKIGAK